MSTGDVNPYQPPPEFPHGTAARVDDDQVVQQPIHVDREMSKASTLAWGAIGTTTLVLTLGHGANYAAAFGSGQVYERLVRPVIGTSYTDEIIRAVGLWIVVHGLTIALAAWLTAGMTLYLIKLVRNREGGLGDLVAGGPWFKAMLVAMIAWQVALFLYGRLFFALTYFIVWTFYDADLLRTVLFMALNAAALFGMAYVFVHYNFLWCVMVDRGLDLRAALARSAELTQGNRGSLAWMYFYFLLFAGPGLFGIYAAARVDKPYLYLLALYLPVVLAIVETTQMVAYFAASGQATAADWKPTQKSEHQPESDPAPSAARTSPGDDAAALEEHEIDPGT